jgi:hypothetical protein
MECSELSSIGTAEKEPGDFTEYFCEINRKCSQWPSSLLICNGFLKEKD